MPLFRFSDPQQALYLLDRELSEELRLKKRPYAMTFRGLLYDPRTQVSTQHIGIVFCVDVPGRDFEIGEKGFLTDAKKQNFNIVASTGEQLSEIIARIYKTPPDVVRLAAKALGYGK